jgi:hypothetical protein
MNLTILCETDLRYTFSMMAHRAWKAELPLSHYPDKIRNPFRLEAADLMRQLRERYLSVILIPAPEPQFEGHCIRAVEMRNPEWYRTLWANRSSIKRQRVKESLQRIRKLQDAAGTYDTLLRELIFQRLTEGVTDENYGERPPVDEVIRYFRTSIQAVLPAQLMNLTLEDLPWLSEEVVPF